MAVAGIDVSSFAVDVVILSDDTDAAGWHRFELEGGTPFERARSLRGRFVSRSWWEQQGVWLVGIEDPHSRQSHTAKALGLVTGAAAVMLPLELTVIHTPTAEWKRLFTGSGSADKARVAFAAAGRGFVPDPPNFNATDAYAIAWAVRALNEQAITKGAA